MQSVFDGIRNYKRSDNLDESDAEFAQDVIGKSLGNKFFVMNAEYFKTRNRLNKLWADQNQINFTDLKIRLENI